MFVAKLTSAPSAHFRELIRSVPGTWIDRVTLSDGTKIFGITAFVSEGTRLRYFADNVDSQGNYLGLFDAELIDDRLPTLTFRYSNHQSDTTHFTSGINIFNSPRGNVACIKGILVSVETSRKVKAVP
jgi:hypothetical protein